MRYDDIDCPPYVPPAPFSRPDGRPPTILDYASHAALMAERYRRAMDNRLPFDDVLRAAGAMARASDELTNAISDSVASGNGQLT